MKSIPMRLAVALISLALIALAWAPRAAGQTEAPRLLDIGELAPDFELTGATRYGILETPVRLSDFRGKTVVLAFFFKVRTKG